MIGRLCLLSYEINVRKGTVKLNICQETVCRDIGLYSQIMEGSSLHKGQSALTSFGVCCTARVQLIKYRSQQLDTWM